MKKQQIPLAVGVVVGFPSIQFNSDSGNEQLMVMRQRTKLTAAFLAHRITFEKSILKTLPASCVCQVCSCLSAALFCLTSGFKVTASQKRIAQLSVASSCCQCCCNVWLNRIGIGIDLQIRLTKGFRKQPNTTLDT